MIRRARDSTARRLTVPKPYRAGSAAAPWVAAAAAAAAGVATPAAGGLTATRPCLEPLVQ